MGTRFSPGRGGSDQFGSSATATQMFTGQERDGGSMVLDYFNARHFSAAMGSFTQPDPANAGGDILNPQSWNAYAYVLGNPLGLVDPSGMCASTDPTPCYSATGTATVTGYSHNPDYATSTNPYNDGFLTFLATTYGFLSGGSSCTNCGGNNGKNPPPANNGTPAPNNGEPPSACLIANINAVNAISKLNVNLSNVVGQPFIFNGGLNVNFSVPGASPSQLNTGRYASSAITRIFGIGHSLHLPAPRGDDPSTYGIDPNTGNFTFTTHIDTVYSTWHTPIGSIIHYIIDVRDKGAHRGPC